MGDTFVQYLRPLREDASSFHGFDVPTLVMHGEDDQIVPINISGKRSAKFIKGAKEIFYPGLPHGLTATNADQVDGALLKFLQAVQQARKAAA